MNSANTIAAVLVFLGAAPSFAQSIDCVIEPKSIVTIVAEDDGIIQQIRVDRGDRVYKGDFLVGLYDELEQLQAELTGARANSDIAIRAQQARLSLRQKELKRVELLSDRNVAAAAVLDDARIELALTELAIEEAVVAQENARIEHAQALALLKRRTLLSPVDGIVMSLGASVGEYANKQLTILTIAVIDPLHVEVFVPGEYFQYVKIGAKYQVTQIAPLTGVFAATVTIVDQLFDAASGTFGVRLEIANPGGTIPAGTRCSVEFEFE